MNDKHTSEADALTIPSAEQLFAGPPEAVMHLLRGELRTPHDLLGAHPVSFGDVSGVVVRARVPRAERVEVVIGDERMLMDRLHDAFFVRFLDGQSLPLAYRLVARFEGGAEREFDDPYRFLPTLGDVDLHLYGEGRHLR